MPAVAVARLSIEGTLFGVQSFSMGLAVLSKDGATSGDLLTWLTAISTNLETFCSTGTDGIGGYASSAATWDGANAYQYESGSTHASAEAGIVYSVTGSPSAPILPSQNAIVASLRTGVAGRSGRGRMYVPNLTISPVTGRIPNATCDAVAAAVGTLLTAISAETLAGATSLPVVCGRTATAAPIPITNCLVDNVGDTQRRRRNKILYTYQGRHTV